MALLVPASDFEVCSLSKPACMNSCMKFLPADNLKPNWWLHVHKVTLVDFFNFYFFKFNFILSRANNSIFSWSWFLWGLGGRRRSYVLSECSVRVFLYNNTRNPPDNFCSIPQRNAFKGALKKWWLQEITCLSRYLDKYECTPWKHIASTDTRWLALQEISLN